MSAVFKGIGYVFRGIGDFYRDKSLWRFVLLPMGVMALTYIALIWGVMALEDSLTAWLTSALEGLPGWLSWLSSLLGGLAMTLCLVSAILIVFTTVGMLYEFLGGIFFDYLTECYCKRHYGIEPKMIHLNTTVRFIIDTCIYSIKSLIWICCLSIMSFIFPIIGQIIFIIVVGRRFAIGNLTSIAACQNVSFRDLCKGAYQHPGLVLGFGVTSYLLQLIPFAILFILPGLILGGAALYLENIKTPPTSPRNALQVI